MRHVRRQGDLTLSPLGFIETDFSEKFGIPRQSSLARTTARIVLEKEYRTPDICRGLESFSRIWLIFAFSEHIGKPWHATVRPPRLGGNTRVGVLASRSPFRPNPLGLSCVVLNRIDYDDPQGPVLYVTGADLLDGTPIYDVKPYVPYADAYPDARGGFTDQVPRKKLKIEISETLLKKIPEDKRDGLLDVLAEDPRPSYQHDPDRVYGLSFAGLNIQFRTDDTVLEVLSVSGG